jgi:pyrroloquinoline quinone biosynthesis protein B
LTQSGLAISAEGRSWVLINASPDIAGQINRFPALAGGSIEAVLLTNADLDHVLGLFQLREGGALTIHATPAVKETLVRGLRLEDVLGSFLDIRWHEPSSEKSTPLLTRQGAASGLSCRALVLSDQPPLYFSEASPGAQSIAYEITDDASVKRVLIAPDVGEITPPLLQAMREADALFFDGTFWSDEELGPIRKTTRTALQMGHLPLKTHNLEILRSSPARHKILLHINNTNPILQPDSPERKAVEAAGVTVGYDGLELTP